jgi:hypothetical protein
MLVIAIYAGPFRIRKQKKAERENTATENSRFLVIGFNLKATF